MSQRHYLGIVEPGPNNWSISFPAFPGVISVGDTFAEVLEHGRDALASALDAMQEDGDDLPPDYTATGDSPGYNPADYQDPRLVVLSVEVASKAVRINVTMEEALLARLDRVAERTHTTRSALLAKGARLVLEATT